MSINGERIYLRVVRPADVTEHYCSWMNDPEVNAYLESRFYPHTMESLQDYVKEKSEDSRTVFLAIVLKNGDRHIGNIKLGPIDWNHRRGDIGIIIGEKDCWGKGYASEAIGLISDYAFNKLNLHKITAGAYQTNPGALKAFLKNGFQEEGIRKQHVYCEGQYLDIIQMGLMNPRGSNDGKDTN
ncbi:MAG: GNAT family N-acetyltransferase [Deltaproteobacteria bacterium]|nr:GNAT family N-acetyltransferase [Deltaproteobacteria bacterium]MBW1944394.1 GNAT family N-acetyltransferase [Deltaproteobacteria bacterium]MBW2206319.1 GNAT family N-acetyltransferase [Deltaproteobacteria bacterium]